jgi:prolyl oligopeptidase
MEGFMRKHLWKVVSFGLATLIIAACGPSDNTIVYPETERGDVVDTYFGEEVADPYRWLEDLDGDATAAWVEAQNAVSFPYLEAIPQRETIKNRLTELWDYERYGIPETEGGRYFFKRNDGLQDQDVLYVAEAIDGEPRALIDPNTFSEDATVALASWVPSPDGEWLAYSTSDGGTDWKTWHIRNVDTGEDLDDAVSRCKFTGASWAGDSKGFYYSRYPALEDGTGDGSKTTSIYYHRRGTAQEEDAHVYTIPGDTTKNPSGTVTRDGRFLIIAYFDGYDANDVYYLPLGTGITEPLPIFDQWDARYDFIGNEGRTLYFWTNKDAPKGRIVAVELGRRSAGKPSELVAEAEETLSSVEFVGGTLICQYLRDAHSLVRLHAADGSVAGEVDLPGMGTARGFSGHGDDPETFFSYTDFTTPTAIYRYAVNTDESTLFAGPEPPIDLSGYEAKQVFFESKDGTRVPMFIVHKAGLTLDGQNPTLLFGYGGFNISRTPSYRTTRMVWLEMGGVMVIANLRGGGEYGREWHTAGTKLQKQNVFDDFIAAAEWLIANGYTSTPKLAIQGGSNGGLLVGAVITQRPDLFGAALPAVGVLDMLRYHTPSANARQWASDYGLSENEDEYRALRAYSPYHKTVDGNCYPPTLITTADHDDRVVPWHSFKFAAAMQRAQGCANPILIRVETRAGHGAGKPTWMQIEVAADQWAFLAKALEMGN